MIKASLSFVVVSISLVAFSTQVSALDVQRPNVVIIYADDLGSHDLGCYGATKIATPRIDRLAAEGIRFTDAHSDAAVCQPSRYALLSGTHLWNSRRSGDNYNLYFHEGQVTLPRLLQQNGYATAIFGKWHNGFGRSEIDWNKPLAPGPLEIGFDTFFGTPRSHNEPPLVFVEDHQVIGLDPADPIRVEAVPGTHGRMTGGEKAKAARPDERLDQMVTDRAVAWLERQEAGKPFFLYLPYTAPHVPLTPAPEFRNTSQAGIYGDFVQQLDACAGRILDTLEQRGLSSNTLVILSSDNGGVYHASALEKGHRTNGALLGQKTDLWEGGNRVPMIVRWPGKAPAGKVRDHLFVQIDLMATIAQAAGIDLPKGSSPDGRSALPALTDPEGPANRTEAAFLGATPNGPRKSLRQDQWIYIPVQGSGGFTAPERPKPWSQPYAVMGFQNSDITPEGQIKPEAPADQLYDLATDPGQTRNLVQEQPERAAAMRKRMMELKLLP